MRAWPLAALLLAGLVGMPGPATAAAVPASTSAATSRSDAWALSLGESPGWTELSPSGTGPSPRPSAAYAMRTPPGPDPAASELIVAGGHFGTAKPDGTAVTDAAFRRFVDWQITPRFPDGLTRLVGQGQFRGEDGSLVRERSHLVVLLYPRATAATNREIREIREHYQRVFSQESVLRVDSLGRVSF